MILIQLLRPSLAPFLEGQSGASLYECALVASLFAVVGIIVLVALAVVG